VRRGSKENKFGFGLQMVGGRSTRGVHRKCSVRIAVDTGVGVVIVEVRRCRGGAD
jgi:hypothetical protein